MIDVSDTPDLVPVAAVLATAVPRETRIVRAGRLRLKESDRLKTTTALIRSLGGRIIENEDNLVIRPSVLKGGTVDGSNDHRIVMAAAIAATICREPVIIRGAEAVKKSYPDFFDDFRKLGGIAEEI